MRDRQARKQRIEQTLRIIQSHGDLPAFAHQMAELMKTLTDDDTTLSRLTSVVLKSVSVTTKVLRIANSVHYNPGGHPISSVSRAITRMGWDNVRDLASGILLFEHFHSKSAGIKEQIVLLMLTGCHARQIAIQTRYPRVEEAYLCGIFRNVGELLVACYLSTDYHKILTLVSQRKISPAEAAEEVLQFSFDELGHAAVVAWNFPIRIGRCMDPEEIPSSKIVNELDHIQAITGFSHSLTTAVYRTGPEESQAAVAALMKRLGGMLRIEEKDLPQILSSSLSDTKDTFTGARLEINDLLLSRQLRIATSQSAGEPIPIDDAVPAAIFSDDPAALLVAEVTALLAAGPGFELNHALMMILEAAYRGGGFDRVLFCLASESGNNIEARLGVGDEIDALIDSFRFPISLRSGPIAPALIARQDLFIDSEREARYSHSPFQQTVKARYYTILPMVIDRTLAGCLYADKLSGRFEFSPRVTELMLKLRDLAGRAVAAKRG